MKRFLLCTADGVTEGDDAIIDIWQSDHKSWLWVDIQNEPELPETQFLQDRLDLSSHDVDEARLYRHPPQFNSREKGFFLLTKPLVSESVDMDFNTQQFAIFFADRLIVTRHQQGSQFLNRYWDSMIGREDVSELHPLMIVDTLCQRLVDRYGSILLELEHRLDEVEDILFEDSSDDLLQELVGYNTALRKMRRILHYHVDVFSRLHQHIEQYHTSMSESFMDIVKTADRFYSMSDMYQGVISDLIDGYISLNSHNLNTIMKILTIVTVIFVPLTLLVGIYGMNFEYMPELRNQNGYPILIGTMLVIASTLLLLFRRMRWL